MKSEKLPFEEDYFINSPISNYEDYRKRKFNVLAIDLIEVLGLRKDMKILDFGCATGGLLYEFKRYGFINLKGTDISYWSIDYGKETYQLDYVLEYFIVAGCIRAYSFYYRN
jgi:2-polyprenyl-3-methyl-5-hydroxy-6-metoxy-1,4-benzoquinol methylase